MSKNAFSKIIRNAAPWVPRSLIRFRAKFNKDLVKLFDSEFYLEENPDVRKSGADPLSHYLKFGWTENRDPSERFSSSWYLSQARELRNLNVCPLIHYVEHGQENGLTPLPPGIETTDEFNQVRAAFDGFFYLQSNPDLAEGSADPVFHFFTTGWKEHRNPSPYFSTAWYLDENPDIREGGANPFIHWVLHGQRELRLGAPKSIALEDIFDWSSIEKNIDWANYNQEDHDAIKPEFDHAFYLSNYKDDILKDIDPVVHYLLLGWQKGYNPSPDFSTNYYFECYPDIKKNNINPFAHWCRWGKSELRETQSYTDHFGRTYSPKVTVIIPNYNHAPYLRHRIKSIADQTYTNYELIILDDKSPDNSCEIIREVVKDLGIDAKLVFNTENSGNVFAQWQKGLSLATGDLIWICESDDFCEPDFLEKIVPSFTDLSVQIAFGQIQFSDVDGVEMPGLDGYREGTEEGIWDKTITRPAAEWFNNAFGVNNVIANVGGCVFRRMELPQTIWDKARTFKICGDWFLYIQIAGTGQITYEPNAKTYFRQHEKNTSASNFHNKYYYDETMEILAELVRQWGIKPETRTKFLGKVQAQFDHFNLTDTLGNFDEIFPIAHLMQAERERPHVQLHFLGFHVGGGELFPINLANAFVGAGINISMMALDLLQMSEQMRERLDSRIPVYHVQNIRKSGRAHYLESASVSIINSHVAMSDAFLASHDQSPIECPYVVTLHGSYVALEHTPEKFVKWILENVSQWIYTAERNLEFFQNREVKNDVFTKLPNAMPQDTRPAPFKRKDLGIGENDIVFTLIARGIKRKGWRAAIEAVQQLRQKHGRDDVHLLLVGEGEATTEVKPLANAQDYIHFLGYQSTINGILRLSDCLVLPTRFSGESFPLCLIQSIQEHLPAIATDIGEIRSMMTTESGDVAGILLKDIKDNNAYYKTLERAMLEMLDAGKRKQFSKVAKQQASVFDMEKLVGSYSKIYDAATSEFELLNQDIK